MRKWLSVVLLLAALILPTPAGAQGGIKLSSINIQLWPEYDQPSMLVIHEFSVDESVTLPVDVAVRFPKDGNLTAVATLVDGSLLNIDYEEPESQGPWQRVTLNVQSYSPHRIEYYQPLTREGNTRRFSFLWFGDYTANEFNVTVQLPSDSSYILTEPAFANTVTTSDGLHVVGIVNQGTLKMGQSYEFKLEYERQSDAVSNPENSSIVQPAEPIGPQTEGRVSIDNLPWVIGGFGLALIGLALFFYWQSTRTPERKSRRRTRSGSVEQETADEEAYCHECGTRAHQGDRFCRTCGSRLRI